MLLSLLLCITWKWLYVSLFHHTVNYKAFVGGHYKTLLSWTPVEYLAADRPILSTAQTSRLKLEFHDADTDILVRILADTSDTRDFLKLILWQAERHADILATILARMSVSVSVSAWNVSLTRHKHVAGRSSIRLRIYSIPRPIKLSIMTTP